MTTRPSTSKPRGKCRYDTESPRGCLAGDSCKFLHGDETISPYDRAKTCKFYTAGYCKWGTECWFKHIPPDAKSLPPGIEPPPVVDDPCGICLEVPTTFGLLSDCSHAFCLDCIRSWREQRTRNDDYLESRMNKRCPYCRTLSSYVFPSSHFYPHGHPGKEAALRRYKDSAARVHCKYFTQSPPGDRYCPFGRDCLYKHLNADGSTYNFPKGVTYYMPQFDHRNRRQNQSTPFNLSHRDELRSLFNDVRTILDSIRPTVAPENVLGNDTAQPPTTEHLMEVLNATELAVAELWAGEFPFAPPPPQLSSNTLSTPTTPLLAPEGGNLGPGSDSIPSLEDISSLSSSPDIEQGDVSAHLLAEHVHHDNRTGALHDIIPALDAEPSPLTDETLSPPPTAEISSTADTSSTGDNLTCDASASDNRTNGVAESRDREGPSSHGGEASPATIVAPAEPPFMTDGRGRVVWSRSGAKDNAVEQQTVVHSSRSENISSSHD